METVTKETFSDWMLFHLMDIDYPVWAKYVVSTNSGHLIVYAHRPEIVIRGGGLKGWRSPHGSGYLRLNISRVPLPKGIDWKDTLVELP